MLGRKLPVFYASSTYGAPTWCIGEGTGATGDSGNASHLPGRDSAAAGGGQQRYANHTDPLCDNNYRIKTVGREGRMADYGMRQH